VDPSSQKKRKKEEKSYVVLVEDLQEGHDAFCNPSPQKLRERLLSAGKPGLVASTTPSQTPCQLDCRPT
jgi:hypothetical protein